MKVLTFDDLNRFVGQCKLTAQDGSEINIVVTDLSPVPMYQEPLPAWQCRGGFALALDDDTAFFLTPQHAALNADMQQSAFEIDVKRMMM